MKPPVLLRLPVDLFGVFSLTLALAILASIPVLNFLALGYLLEASGRTARSGRWRDGVFGQRHAAMLGLLAGLGWFLVLPIRFLSGLRRDADLLGETAPSFLVTSTLLALFTAGLVVLVILGILFLGWWYGRDPEVRRGFFPTARDGLLRFLAALRLPRLFSLGVQGWFGGLVWLAVPIGVLYAASLVPNNAAALPMLLGLILLVPVATSLPLIQARFAASGRFADLFDWPAQREHFRHAPLASLVAVVVTLAAALPLYLLKIELPPREIVWLPGLLFIVLLWPAKILTGWAIHRSGRSPRPRARPWIWLARVTLVATGLAYGLWIWTMQYLSWTGARSFFEQHAFLLPAPLF